MTDDELEGCLDEEGGDEEDSDSYMTRKEVARARVRYERVDVIRRVLKVRRGWFGVVRRSLSCWARRWRMARRAGDIHFAYVDLVGCRERTWARLVLGGFVRFWVRKRMFVFGLRDMARRQFFVQVLLVPEQITYLKDLEYYEAWGRFLAGCRGR